MNLTGDERTLSAAQGLVTGFLEALPEQAIGAGPAADWASGLPRLNEAITVPTQVPWGPRSSPLLLQPFAPKN